MIVRSAWDTNDGSYGCFGADPQEYCDNWADVVVTLPDESLVSYCYGCFYKVWDATGRMRREV